MDVLGFAVELLKQLHYFMRIDIFHGFPVVFIVLGEGNQHVKTCKKYIICHPSGMHQMGFWGFYQAQGSNLGSNPKLSGWSSYGMTPQFFIQSHDADLQARNSEQIAIEVW